MNSTPQAVSKEREKIESMFDSIAPTYDFLNHFFSFSIDKRWRKKVLKIVSQHAVKDTILDLSTGTGDMAIAMAKKTQAQITGADISSKMLEIGQQKIEKLKLTQRITMVQADAENLPFECNTFDICTVSFGVRNFEHLEKGIAEIYRVLKPGGKLVILEFRNPEQPFFKLLYKFYSQKIMPFWGKIISKNKYAYSYLPKSVETFPQGEAFLKILQAQQFKNTQQKVLTMGIAGIYAAIK